MLSVGKGAVEASAAADSAAAADSSAAEMNPINAVAGAASLAGQVA